MECYHCHKDVPIGAKYCSNCGKKLTHRECPKGRGIKIYNIIMAVCYFVALLTCFICNIAVENNLSWFYIVFFSLMLSFFITNLPFLIKQYRIAVPTMSAIASLYLLLLVSNKYMGGNWFFSIALPITSFSVLMALFILLIVTKLKWNWVIKSGLIALILAAMIIIINPMCNHLVMGENFNLYPYFDLNHWPTEILGNKIAAWSLVIGAVICFGVGSVFALRTRRTK